MSNPNHDNTRDRDGAGTSASNSLDTDGLRGQALAQSQTTHTGDSPWPLHGHRAEAEMTNHVGGFTSPIPSDAMAPQFPSSMVKDIVGPDFYTLEVTESEPRGEGG
jgi:hypothetical protein